jgi:hypothetical protein
MFKKILIAAAAAGALATFSQAAEARVNVFLGAGTPGYGYGGGYGYAECQGRLGYRHCYGGGPDYGYYPPRRIYDAPRPDYYYDDQEDFARDMLSCREARSLIRARGYRDIVARDCTGGTYSFFATKRGQPYKINLNAYRGRITSINRI